MSLPSLLLMHSPPVRERERERKRAAGSEDERRRGGEKDGKYIERGEVEEKVTI